MAIVEQKLPTLPEHMSSSPFLGGVHVTRSLVLCACIVDRCLSFCPFVLFLLAIVISVLLRFTDSDYPFGIFKLFSLQCNRYTKTSDSMVTMYIFITVVSHKEDEM